MIEFGYILIIIFEIFGAVLIIFGLISLEKRVKKCLSSVNAEAEGFLNSIRNLRENVSNFNKSVKKVKKFDFKKFKETVAVVFDIINLLLLIRSFDFKRGKKLRWHNIKKLVPYSVVKKLISGFKKFV